MVGCRTSYWEWVNHRGFASCNRIINNLRLCEVFVYLTARNTGVHIKYETAHCFGIFVYNFPLNFDFHKCVTVRVEIINPICVIAVAWVVPKPVRAVMREINLEGSLRSSNRPTSPAAKSTKLFNLRNTQSLPTYLCIWS